MNNKTTMATRIGINGFGRMGRLAFRAGWGNPDIEFVHLNEIGGDGVTSAHLLFFDSVHGRWNREVRGEKDNLVIYFAGHGEIDASTGLGYWLPVDAEKDSKTNWISSREVSMQLERLAARHILVIADSCYSGALTRSTLAREEVTSDDKARGRWMDEVSSKRSRKRTAPAVIGTPCMSRMGTANSERYTSANE